MTFVFFAVALLLGYPPHQFLTASGQITPTQTKAVELAITDEISHAHRQECLCHQNNIQF